MRPSFVVAVVIATAVGISVSSIIHSPVWAQGVPPGGRGAKTGAQTSTKEAACQLKTDTGKTKDDVKAMDVNKAKEDVGQVKQDVQGLKDSVKDMQTYPFANNSAGREQEKGIGYFSGWLRGHPHLRSVDERPSVVPVVACQSAVQKGRSQIGGRCAVRIVARKSGLSPLSSHLNWTHLRMCWSPIGLRDRRH